MVRLEMAMLGLYRKVFAMPNDDRGAVMAARREYSERMMPPVADPLACVVHLAGQQNGEYVCYEDSHGWSVAVGVAAELTVDRDRILLRSAAGEVQAKWHTSALSLVPRLLDQVPIAGWRAYGWCGFGLAAAKEGLADLAGDGRYLHLVIPAAEIRFHSSYTLLRALDGAALDELQAQLNSPRAASYRAEGIAVDQDGAGPYMAAVDKAVGEIKAAKLQKVILSRVVPVRHEIDLVGTYAVGRRANTPARSYLLSLGGMKAAGFSPETVVEVSESGLVKTNPLAGTRSLTGQPEIDSALYRELTGSVKEIFEHAISVKVAHDELTGLCGKAAVEIPEFMVVRERGTVQHLASTLRGQLAEGIGAWDAFAALFPAVTVSGVPKLASYPLIRELESAERGLYSGAVLTYDSGGAMDAAVVLRTVFEQEGRTWLRAGAGIVEHSRPEREFAETCEKLWSIARYLVPLHPGA
jgi:salicylate synthase